MFAHLCEVVDDDKDVYDSRIREISKLIILEGKEATFMFIVFFNTFRIIEGGWF